MSKHRLFSSQGLGRIKQNLKQAQRFPRKIREGILNSIDNQLDATITTY